MPKKSKGRSNKSSGYSTRSNGTISIGVTAKRKRDILTSVGFLDDDEELPSVHIPVSSRSKAYYREKEERRQKKERRQRKKEKKNEERRQWDEDMEYARPIDYDDISYDCENGLGEYQYCSDDEKYDELLEIVLDEDENTVVSQFSQLSKWEEEALQSASSCCKTAASRFSFLTLVELGLYVFGWHWLYNNAT